MEGGDKQKKWEDPVQKLLKKTKLVKLHDTGSGSYRIVVPKRWLKEMGVKQELLMVFDDRRKVIVLASPDLLAKLVGEELKDFKGNTSDILDLIRKALQSHD